MRGFVVAAVLSVYACVTIAPAIAASPVPVMVVGTYHMSNPNHDMHDVRSDDVLAPGRQAELERIVAGLARFRPTVVDVEWPKDLTDKRYRAYLAGTLPPSHNEVVQLGLRLAKTMHLSHVNGIDVDGDFPYEPVEKYARAHGTMALLKAADNEIAAEVSRIDHVLAHGTIGDALRSINDPAFAMQGNTFYRTALKVGGGAEQPGAELLTAWYKRNFYICAHILQSASPGDRVVVIYGYGHQFLLRQCVGETPEFRLVEANAYLPE